MTGYHFHAADGTQFRDEDGEELADLQAAQAVALDVVLQVLPGIKAEFWNKKIFSVSVKEETGRLVALLTMTAAVDPVAQADVPPETPH